MREAGPPAARRPLRAVLFDLDGTLLPLDFEVFLPRLIPCIGEQLKRTLPGADPVAAWTAATRKMMSNEGPLPTAEVCWSEFAALTGHAVSEVRARFLDAFQSEPYRALGHAFTPVEGVASVLRALLDRGLKVVVATNPLFPRVAVDERLRWAGLDPRLFHLVTSSEVMTHCKPHVGYYLQLVHLLGVEPAECLMVGNDVEMDLVPAAATGIRTCLVENDFQVLSRRPFEPDHRCPLAAIPELPL